LLRVLAFLFLTLTCALQLAGQAQSKLSCHPGTYKFSGTVLQGETFSHAFGGLVFNLEPTEFGWTIDIAQGERHYLANMPTISFLM
jgi:hypothetical protein